MALPGASDEADLGLCSNATSAYQGVSSEAAQVTQVTQQVKEEPESEMMKVRVKGANGKRITIMEMDPEDEKKDTKEAWELIQELRRSSNGSINVEQLVAAVKEQRGMKK